MSHHPISAGSLASGTAASSQLHSKLLDVVLRGSFIQELLSMCLDKTVCLLSSGPLPVPVQSPPGGQWGQGQAMGVSPSL